MKAIKMICLAGMLLLLAATVYLSAQVTESSSVDVPTYVKSQPAGYLILGQVSDVDWGYNNNVGTPIVTATATQAELNASNNKNEHWDVTVSRVDSTAGQHARIKLTRQVWSHIDGMTQDTTVITGNKVENTDVWDDIDIRLNNGLSVGDNFTIWFSIYRPIKLLTDGEIDLKFESTDSLNTY